MAVLLPSNERVFAVDRGDLHLVAERIVDVDAALAAGRIGAGGFERGVHARVVPIGDRVADMVDNSRGGFLVVAEIARDDEGTAFAGFGAAEGEIGAAHA